MLGKRYCAPYMYNIYKSIHNNWCNNKSGDKPLIIQPNGKHISYEWWRKELQILLKEIKNYQPCYTPHALRKTGATIYYSSGLGSEFIKIMGRWSSDTWSRYIQPTCIDAAFKAKELLDKFKYINKN